MGRDKAGLDGDIEAALHNLGGHTLEVKQPLNVLLGGDDRCRRVLAQNRLQAVDVGPLVLVMVRETQPGDYLVSVTLAIPERRMAFLE